MATTKNFSVDRETEQAVRSILEQVANDGDAAVRRYTSEFDRVDRPTSVWMKRKSKKRLIKPIRIWSTR